MCGCYAVTGMRAFGPDDVITIITKRLDIVIDAFTLRPDAVCHEMVDDLWGSDGMGFIRVLTQIIQKE